MHRNIFEPLERRSYFAVNATFNAGTGTLSIVGDTAADQIIVTRDIAGLLRINDGTVSISGGAPSVTNTTLIQIFGGDGADDISLDESTAAFPPAQIFGGTGNDTLRGSAASDSIFGEIGDDQLAGRDGADLLEGGDGIDTIEVSGTSGDETFTLTANGTRVRFDRLAPVPSSLDIGTAENLVLSCNGGNDSFSATGNLATLITINVDGGAGNDTLLGSNGADTLRGGDDDDFIDGQQGNDNILLGDGADAFQWDPGDGSDTVEGQAGHDTLRFNGSAGNEVFTASANGGRVLFTRNLGNIVMDLDDVEQLDLRALGGTDTVTVNSLSGTDLTELNLSLAGSLAGTTGDAAADLVIVNGTNADDVIDVVGGGSSASVLGLAAQVNVAASEGANDSLVVNALGGEDRVTATTLPAGVIKLTLDGGAFDDMLLGSQGADIFLGGDGADFVFGDNGDDLALLGAGDDLFQWEPGDGNDVVEGQADSDSLRFFGSESAESIDVFANGGRVNFFRNVANVTIDMDGVETLDFQARGGADSIVIGDLSGTDMTRVDLDLRGADGTHDNATDSITINGTNGPDVFGALGNASGISTFGLQTAVNIAFAEHANDRLTLNALGGDDTIDASSLEAGAIQLQLNGGLGADMLLGSEGDDLINGGDGNDTALMGDGDDSFTWNPGDDNDTIEGQAGIDQMIFNGANVAENITFSASGGRVVFFRNVASVTMDLNDTEAITFNALGGADIITVNDLSGTDVTGINLNLTEAANLAGADNVIVHGTSGDDVILPRLNGSNFTLSGLAAAVSLTGFDSANDRVSIHSFAGDDIVDASEVGPGGPNLTIDGGINNDTLVGTAGADVIAGGDGNDVLLSNGGTDALDGGTGENIVINGGPGSGSTGIFSLFGTDSSNTITISRNAAGQIFSNGVPIPDATVANTVMIRVFGMAGDDNLVLDESGGALPAVVLYGAAGNDTLTGGFGGDWIFGGAGSDAVLGKGGFDFLFGGINNDTLTGGDADDSVFGEADSDLMIWNPGDDTDLNEGGSGIDTVEVNGGGGDEVFTVTANGARVRFDRLNPAPFSIDIGTSENFVLNAAGGDDSFSATGNLAVLISISVDGGAGNDTLLGSNGIDLLTGGDDNDFIDGQQGNDVALMGAGDDTYQWDPGDGSDTVEGQAGADTLRFNGSAGSEIFDASSNGGRLRFTRNLGNIVMDLDDVETLTLNALGGVDAVTVNDIQGTDVTQINLNLAGAIGGSTGDAQADSFILHGTAGDDSIELASLGGGSIAISGLPYAVQVNQVEQTFDGITIRPLGGTDIVTVDNGTFMSLLTIDLGSDSAADQVVLNGRTTADIISVTDTLNSTDINGLSVPISVFGADFTGDSIRINALSGADTISVNQTGGVGTIRRVLVDGGDDLDTITVANTDAAGSATILPSTGDDNISVNADGLFAANAIFTDTQRIGSLTVGPNGRATIAAGSSTVLTASSLSITSTGRLDITDNDVIIDYAGGSPIQTIQNRLASGFAGGAWNGVGIISSTSGSQSNTGIGFAEATDLFAQFPAQFKGQEIDGTAVLLSHTLLGDANLDGAVNSDDFNLLSISFGQSSRRWSQGDFNYNGAVNSDDFNQLAVNFGQTASAGVAAARGVPGRIIDDVM